MMDVLLLAPIKTSSIQETIIKVVIHTQTPADLHKHVTQASFHVADGRKDANFGDVQRLTSPPWRQLFAKGSGRQRGEKTV